MINLRTYGESPFHIAVIHGGPGASGTMAPVARELSSKWGILEPLQTAKTLQGQVLELHDVLIKRGDPPIILVGFSWGAILSYIFSATYPQIVQKLILISSAVFEEDYAESMAETRLNRLSPEERKEVYLLMDVLNNPRKRNKDESFSRLGELMTKADVCDPLTLDIEMLDCQYEIFQHVWNNAQKYLRISAEIKQ